MPTARPCPWCFNDAITVNSERVLSGWWSQVTCDECGATGPRAITSDPDNGEAKALDEWNDGWEPSEAQQGLIPIPDGYAEQ